ncbi:MAG TPA: FHA domain-containing protein, partial [Anaerolineales bacterium]|nr:FHA domain-containing protein [Anaerolineales bacterium]
YRTLGLWEPARLQGRVAGRNMAGGSDVFRRRVHYNATRLYDLDFAGAGEPLEKPGDEVLIDYPRGSGSVRYCKLIIRDGKLVGAVLLGHRKEHVRKYGMAYRDLIEKKTDVSSVSKDLLDPFFDLASWMDSHEIGDQIDSVRSIREAPKTPTFAAMRQSRHELSTASPQSSSAVAVAREAMLLSDGKKIPLKPVMQIGRKPENDLVLNDPDVSGQHARIRFEESAFLLEDLKSTNGTFLNGERISTPMRLASGAQIQVGGTQLQFVVGTPIPVENLRMTSAGLPEAAPPPSALPTDPVWGTLQIGGKGIPLRMLYVILGRDTQVDIPLDDPTVSYKHAQLEWQGIDAYLRDLGSRNGTFVKGERISIPHRLEHGDVIALGGTEIIFRAGTTPAPKVVKSAPAPVKPQVDEAKIEAGTAPVESVPVQTPAKDEAPAPPRPEPIPALPPPAPSPEKSIAAGAPLALTLVVRSGNLSGQSFPLNQSPMTVGRDSSSHIAISDKMTSWNHALLKQEDMKWFVRDLKSSNGTFLNDKRLEPHQPYPLQAGDRLKFGDTLLEVT